MGGEEMLNPMSYVLERSVLMSYVLFLSLPSLSLLLILGLGRLVCCVCADEVFLA